MLGYFILKEDVERLGLLKNSEIKRSLQETYFVVTDRDVKEQTHLRPNSAKFENISNYLNKYYFHNAVELTAELIKNK
jgi:mannitol-specific phosphotransferase system IIBC component